MEAPRGNSRRFLCHIACSAALLLALSSIVAAEDYPTRPVRLIVPFPPGGSNDVVGRLVASQLSERLGQQVFVDNRGGAGGVIGTEAAANAAPDGYALLISGHVNIVFSSLIQTTPFIQSGQLKALGTGGQQRSPVLPDVPTIAEAGVPGYEANNWWGIVAPAGTPLPIVEKLKNDVHAALQSPKLQEQFAREGASAVEMSSAEFGKYIVTEITKWGEVVEKSKIRPQ
jgi:tripartite-type tricarboxylate transporter receptor subunit TctC